MIQGKLILLIGTEIGNLERRNAVILRYFTEFGTFGAITAKCLKLDQ